MWKSARRSVNSHPCTTGFTAVYCWVAQVRTRIPMGMGLVWPCCITGIGFTALDHGPFCHPSARPHHHGTWTGSGRVQSSLGSKNTQQLRIMWCTKLIANPRGKVKELSAPNVAFSLAQHDSPAIQSRDEKSSVMFVTANENKQRVDVTQLGNMWHV